MLKRRYKSFIISMIIMSFVFNFFEYSSIKAYSVGKTYGVTILSRNTNNVTLSWNKTSSAQSYKIYKYNSTKKAYVAIGATSKRSYTISNLSSGKVYFFRIRGYSRKNSRYYYGAYSNTITCVTKTTRPTNIHTTSVTSNTISLSWNKSPRATGYIIFKYNPTTKVSTTVTRTSKTSYKISNLKSNTAYYYFVSPYVLYKKNTYRGLNSYILKITTTKPISTPVPVAKPTTTSDSATPTPTIIAEPTSVTFPVEDTNTDTPTPIDTISSTDNKVNTSSNENLSSTEEPTTSPTTTPTSSPTPITLKSPTLSINMNTLNKLKISWTSVSNADGYTLYKYSDDTQKYTAIKTTTSTSYTDSSITHSKTYKYKVRAYTTTNTSDILSPYSNESSIFTGSYGIDVSKWQGTIDWKKVANAGVEFAIIRATTYSSSGSSGTHLIKDQNFDTYVKNATAAGIKVGAYVYSYADTVAEAENEAKLAIDIVKNSGVKLTYPITCDFERSCRATTSYKTANTNMIIKFCDTIKNAGYNTNVYSGANFLLNYINFDSIKKYGIWVARYKNTSNYPFPSSLESIKSLLKSSYDTSPYTNLSNVTMWQYTDKGSVSGISGSIDMNYSYINYR